MPSCSDCKHWITARVTDYDSGDRVFNLKCEDGKGECQELKIQTPESFGCNKHAPGDEHFIHLGRKFGAPHLHYVKGPCPDCKDSPTGPGWGCLRCAGTGEVRHYDDGFIGENRTYKHPKDPVDVPVPNPTCPSCANPIELTWKACPHCAHRLADDATTRATDARAAAAQQSSGLGF
jgi:hypothetical protein